MRYTYEDFWIDITEIYNQIKQQEYKFDLILGFVRGGLIPAVCISHKTGVKVEPIIVEKTEAGNNYEFSKTVSEYIAQNKSFLIVDDILDSGKTIQEFLKQHPQIKDNQYKTAFLIYNTDRPIVADFYGQKIHRSTNNIWFNFWWESI